MLEEENRLEALVSDLLLLASVDEQERPPDETPIDLHELARRRGEPLASRRRHRVASDGAAFVSGRADQLTRVIGNLLDNAARFAHRTVELSIVGGVDTVRVAGRRRWSRNRASTSASECSNGLPGSITLGPVVPAAPGLGLALAKGIVEHHGGTIRIDDSPLGGARVIVELPVAALPSR